MTESLPYYWASAGCRPLPDTALQEEITTEACIIGAGLTGLSTAWHLAQAGVEAVIVEAHHPGHGASGRSGGQVLPGFGCSMARLRAMVGERAAQQLWALSLDGVALVADLATRLGIHCDLKCGHVVCAPSKRHAAELLALRHDLQDRHGYPTDYLERDALQAHVASPRYVAGLVDRRALHLHPLRFTLGLADAVAASGVRCFGQSPAVQLQQLGGHWRVRTNKGAVRCQKLFVCTNAYLHQIAPRLAPPMAGHTLPVASAMLATEPLPQERMPLPDGWAGHDTNWVVDYFRPTEDGRLLFGGRAWYGGAVPQDVLGMVRARLLHAFPQLHDAAIHSAWGGLIAITTNRMPHVGSLGKHSWFAHGYSGHGMALSVLLGQAMAQAALGEASAFAALAQVPQRRFPGGRLLAQPLVQLAMAAARLRDSI